MSFHWAIDSFLFQPCYCRFASVWDHCPVVWPNLDQALAFRQMILHLSLEYFGIQKRSCSTQWQRGVQVLWVQTTQTITPTTTVVCLTVEMRCWYEHRAVLICCVWFASNMVVCIMAKHLHFGLVFPKLFCFVQKQLCCRVLYGEKRLSLGRVSQTNNTYSVFIWLCYH